MSIAILAQHAPLVSISNKTTLYVPRFAVTVKSSPYLVTMATPSTVTVALALAKSNLDIFVWVGLLIAKIHALEVPLMLWCSVLVVRADYGAK